jgi:hypothetical protein
MAEDDWIKQERDHEHRMTELRMKDQWRKREALTERITAVCVAFGIVASLAVVAALIYFWQASTGQRGLEVEKACVAAGGTWTSIGGGTAKPVCVHIAKVEQ